MILDAGMTSEEFTRRARRLLVLTWVVPAVFGLSFLIFIKMFTAKQMLAVLTTPAEPLFVIISLILSVWYLMHYLKPVSEFLRNPSEENGQKSLIRVRGFPIRYWGMFLLYLMVAPYTVIYSAEYYADFVPKEFDWLRIHLVALIVSIIVGLPIFFRTLDLFGRALQGIRLEKPIISIRLRVFLIAALVPLLVDTMLVQYYWTRTGYFTLETFTIWGSLQVLAVAGAMMFMRSFAQSLSPLENVLEGKRGVTDTHQMLACSTDELGVLTSRYQELLGHLHLRRRALEIGNRFLRTGEKGISIGGTYDQLVDICREALQVDMAFLFLHDGEANELLCVAQTGSTYNSEGHFRVSLDEASAASYTFKQAKLTAISNVDNDSRASARIREKFHVKSVIAAPLIVEGIAIGVVTGIMQNRERQFSARDSDLISLLANEAASAVHSQRLQESRMKAESAFREASEFAHVTLQSIGDGVITTDLYGCIQYMNPVAENLTGFNQELAQWRQLSDVLLLVEADSGMPIDDPVEQCVKTGYSFSIPGQIMLVERDSRNEFAVDVRVSPLRDAEGDLRGVVVVFHDTTELSVLTHRLSYQASHDALTGLLNRREFEARLELALESSRNDDVEHALCYMDMNQFKVVNDTCGHVAGDELLKQLAVRMRASTREADSIARLGGDEFGLLLEGCHLEQAENVANSILDMVRDFRFMWGDKVFDIGMSIGLVPISAASGSITDVLSAADSACYMAKDLGRNRMHVFEHDDLALVRHRGDMQRLQQIRRALDEDLFRLYEQQIQSLSDKTAPLHYSEVLLRMEVDDELHLPSAFLSVAERYHLMPAIDRWVVKNTLHILKARCRDPGSTRLSINLSGQSLCDEDFLEYVLEEIRQSGVNPGCLCFEVTETTAIANMSRAIHMINGLKRQGCRFALDDFGSGLSSFNYLKSLPVDYLKIDGAFVKDMHKNAIDRAMVESINQIGHLMGIQTVAEFVTSDDVLAECSKLGIDYVQGYHISRPRKLEYPLSGAVSQ
jgi:diguanylate cyclase (GGDEF)-like protein/PAS domain S-box-containing protein